MSPRSGHLPRLRRAARASRPLAILAAAAAAGCSGPGPRERPTPYAEAASAEARSAEEAYLTGRFGEAVTSLRETVRLHLEAGDLPGAARSQLNLALAERASGDTVAAAAAAGRLDELTPGAVQQVRERGGAGGPAGAELEAAAAWLDALLALDRGDTARAAALVPPAGIELAGSSPLRGRIQALRADIALRGGRFGEAVRLAGAARSAAGEAGDPSEVAHAWSLEGAGRAGLGDWTGARSAYLAAVAAEERVGAGTPMAADLRRLADVAAHLGDDADSRLYTLRADAIAAAGADRR